jgi:1-aminocyclopropane-1-carboxylate deaminase/D-cysteine desulfhydrase-like pyridoxal-dependent ACC family enzyme
LGVSEIFVKMDAETGFALGGNKVRKLEYELEAGRLSGATCLITAGGPQSNHCRVTAAFAARAGLRCILVMQAPQPAHATGNVLLHRLFGAEVRTVPDRDARAPGMADVAAEVEGEGGRPLVVPIGASTGLGCLGYARAALELTEQLDALGPRPQRTLVFVASSSCGTLAGLVLGLAILGREDVELVGVSADADADELREKTLQIAAEGADLLESRVPITAARIVTTDGQVGAGYGIPTEASTEAADLFGRLAGLVLDPTYTAKAAAGMIDWIREHGTPSGERVVFLHTGGHPALLA